MEATYSLADVVIGLALWILIGSAVIGVIQRHKAKKKG